MNCIYCGGKTRVEETATDGVVTYRRLVCRKCYRLMYSEETIRLGGDAEQKLRQLREEQNQRARRRKAKSHE